MTTKETVNAKQIEALAGDKATKNYANNKLHTDPTFPRPIIEQRGVGASEWFKHEIVAWLKTQNAQPKKSGQQKIEPPAGIDMAQAQQFIRTRRAVPVILSNPLIFPHWR